MRVLAIAVLSVLLAAISSSLTAADVQNDAQLRLERDADRVTAIVALQLSRYATASDTLSVLRPGADSVSAWGTAVTRLGLETELVAAYSIGAVSLVEPDAVEQLHDDLADLDVAGVELHPRLDERARPPERLAVIDRVHPLGRNRAALGFDVLTNPAAARAAERALLTRRPSMSDALTLVQEPGDQTGLAVYAPWYGPDGQVAGLTNLVLRGSDFLTALAPRIGDLSLQVADDVDGTVRLVGAIGDVETELRSERVLDVMGQQLSVTVAADQGYLTPAERAGPWLVAGAFLVIGLLVASVVHVVTRREQHAVALTEQRTAELVATNDELERAVRVRDDFLSVVSHELRTPVTVIQGMAATLVSGRGGDVAEDVRDLVARIERQSVRLGRLVEDVLTAAELRSGTLAIAPADLLLADLLGEVGDRRDGVTGDVHVDIPDDLRVHADARHVTRMVGALLANAAIYGDPPVIVRAWADGGEVVVQVRDHGPGVPDSLADRVFEPFSQADSGETRESRGIGLGLAIVQELCERNGGSVTLVRGTGVGAVFELRLPAGDGTSAPHGPDDEAEVASSPSTDDGRG